METLHRVLGFLRPHWNKLTWLLTWAGQRGVAQRTRARTVLAARRTTADQPFVLPVLGQVELGVPAAAQAPREESRQRARIIVDSGLSR